MLESTARAAATERVLGLLCSLRGSALDVLGSSAAAGDGDLRDSDGGPLVESEA